MDFVNRISNDPKSIITILVDSFKCLTNSIDKFCGKCAPWQIILGSVIATFIISYIYDAYRDIETDLYTHFKRKLLSLPFIKAKVMSELAKTQKALENDIFKANKGLDYVRELPKKGLNKAEVHSKIDDYLKMSDAKWEEGACSGCVYGADEDLTDLTTSVYKKFAWSNVMHADVFPDVRKMESEVVRMVCTIMNGDKNSCGTMTSGGTESIMLACKAYRDLARKKGVKRPEMVIPISAHAAFHKAGQYFNIRVHKVPVDPVTKKAIPSQMKKYINSNTIMLVGSAPSFGHGVVDPIEDIAKLGVKYDIPVHVDACLGGFLVAFMEEAGFKLPLFDFRVPGVTSISCDTHKYGYTPKGSSCILYRNRDYREHQYFSSPDWPGGIYVSPTFAGSRPGSAIAMAWATMMYFGRSGYVEATRKIVETTNYIADEVRKIKELEMMAQSEVSVVAFTSNEFNVLRLLDELSHHWHLSALQNPVGIHFGITKMHTKPGIKERFVADLRKAVENIMKQPDRKLGKIAQIYCSSQSVPDPSIISDVSYLYLDACYNTYLEKNDSEDNSNNNNNKNKKNK